MMNSIHQLQSSGRNSAAIDDNGHGCCVGFAKP